MASWMHGYARMASARDRMCRMCRMHQTVVYLAYIRVIPLILIHGPAVSRYPGLSAWTGWGMYPRVEPHIRRTSVNGPSPDIRRGAVWRISPYPVPLTRHVASWQKSRVAGVRR